ncbi:MAG: hypothetical protein QMC77_01530 [Methanocellales archaeon]|nr:hypothetical protein [Methanocellales archaeon]
MGEVDGNFEYGIEKGKERYVIGISSNVDAVIITSRFTLTMNLLRSMV